MNNQFYLTFADVLSECFTSNAKYRSEDMSDDCYIQVRNSVLSFVNGEVGIISPVAIDVKTAKGRYKRIFP